MTWSLWGIHFHWYGFIVGLAGWAGYEVVAKRWRAQGWVEQELASLMLVTVVGGLLGARSWHVMTEWSYYAVNLSQVVAVWRGGLSILGGVVGGSLASWWWLRQTKSAQTWWQVADVAVPGLALSQAIGRLANWVNQELYGYPTQLPWGIWIEPNRRLVGFEEFAFFHPLFAYEMAGTLFAASLMWWWSQPRPRWNCPTWLKVGSGRWFGSYVVYYCLIRWMLEFGRPDKSLGWLRLGINQWWLLVIGTLTVIWLYYSSRINRPEYDK